MTKPSDPAALAAVLRTDLHAFIERTFREVVPGSPFLDNWHIEALAYALSGVARGETKRLLVTMPPRYLKSIAASVALPAWVLGRDPSRRIVCVSYSDELAAKHARDCRQVMESAWYRSAFPKTRLGPSKQAVLEFVTTAGGYRLSTSTGGTLTGRGGNLIIIDDPLKPADAASTARREAINEWFGTTLYSRLDNKQRDGIVLVMQRLHADDLVAHVASLESWNHLNLPAIADEDVEIPLSEDEVYARRAGDVLHPERESAADLKTIRRSLGSAAFHAQYLQHPVPAGGTLVKWAWFRRYEAPFQRRAGDVIVLSWDPALVPGADHSYSVCTVWAVRGHAYYLLDVWRDQVDFPTLRKTCLASLDRWPGAYTVIERTAHGFALYQELQSLHLQSDPRVDLIRIATCTPKGDKVSRLLTQSAKIEAGQVHLPDHAPWLAAFKDELLQFPQGKFDDQVDSFSQFLYRMDFPPFRVPYSRVTPIYARD